MPKRKSAKSKLPVAIAMLIEDHKKVRKMFKEFENLNGDESKKQALVEKTCEALAVHAQLEEEVFYPALREAFEDEKLELVDEAEVEHQVAKQLIQQLQTLEVHDPQYSATFTVLAEYVTHHIEEEESEIFKEGKRSDIDFDDLAQRMNERKREIQQELGIDEASSSGGTLRQRGESDSQRGSRSRVGYRT